MGEGKKQARWWWFESHNFKGPKRSPWLVSTLAELDDKTSAMLKLIEEDAESFAQRAEMYYKKRPELINMVEDFYRAHRSLAERHDQLRSESVTRLGAPWASPLYVKHRPEKLTSSTEESYDSHSETFDQEDSGGESEVDDPEPEEEETDDSNSEIEEEEVSSEEVVDDEVAKLREEVERLRQENEMQREQLVEKDEEKREVIRQLCLAVDVVKQENMELRKSKAKESPKKWSTPEFNKLKAAFMGKLLNGSSRSQV